MMTAIDLAEYFISVSVGLCSGVDPEHREQPLCFMIKSAGPEITDSAFPVRIFQ